MKAKNGRILPHLTPLLLAQGLRFKLPPLPAEYPEYSGRNWAANSEGITGEELQQFIDQRLFLPIAIGD